MVLSEEINVVLYYTFPLNHIYKIKIKPVGSKKRKEVSDYYFDCIKKYCLYLKVLECVFSMVKSFVLNACLGPKAELSENSKCFLSISRIV